MENQESSAKQHNGNNLGNVAVNRAEAIELLGKASTETLNSVWEYERWGDAAPLGDVLARYMTRVGWVAYMDGYCNR